MPEEFQASELDKGTHPIADEGAGTYDHLFIDEPEVPIDKSSWPELVPRQQRAFTPFRPHKRETEKTSVDRLMERLLLPSPESMEAASKLVVPRLYDSADPVIRRLLEEHAGQRLSSNDVLLAFQTNQVLREESARYLLFKVSDIKNINRLPRRVAVNSGKSDRFGNKDISNSHEMAVSLALRVLEGSFKYNFNSEPVIRDETGEVIDGQHRAAAEFLIGLPLGTVN